MRGGQIFALALANAKLAERPRLQQPRPLGGEVPNSAS
jgi:hypothetical protein